MKKREKFIKISDLSVSKLLLDFAKSLANATQEVVLDLVVDENNAVSSAINVSVAKQGSEDKAVIMPIRI